MCSIATKEPVRKRRSSRLSQSEDVSGNGTDTGSVAEEQTEDEDDLTNMTPRKRTRANSLRQSARKLKTNGLKSLVNGTIEELDENNVSDLNLENKLSDTPSKQKKSIKTSLENGLTNGKSHVKSEVNENFSDADDINQENGVESVDKKKSSKQSARTKSVTNNSITTNSNNLNDTTNSHKSPKVESGKSISQESQQQPQQQPTVIVPRSDCLTNLLIQSLQSGDDLKLNTILNHNQEKVMENTLRSLPNEYVSQLFQSLNKLLLKNSTNPYYISWMRKLFQCKVTTIVNLPNIRTELISLSDILNIRCDLLERCYKLKGRLDLMLSLAENETKVPEKQKIILYEDSSDSEPEDNLNQDENLMRLMDSDDDEDFDTQIPGELDAEDEQDLEDALLED